MQDLNKCNLGSDALIISDWMLAHKDILATIGQVGQNLLSHIFGLTSNLIAAVTDIQNN